MSDPVIPEKPFALTPGDQQSQAWERLKRHLQERQQRLRQQLEGDLDERLTAKLRGQLAEIRRLLDLGKDT